MYSLSLAEMRKLTVIWNQERNNIQEEYVETRNVLGQLYHINWSLLLSRIVWLEHREKKFRKTLKISKQL